MRKLRIPAIRSKMGIWVYYVTALSFDEVNLYVRSVHDELYKSALLSGMIQKSIAASQNRIAHYLETQKERFFNEEEYLRLKDSYILDNEKMNKAKKDMIVMHPLPRVNEIAIEVDNDSRAVYFKQAEYGMYVRMALIVKLLGVM